MYGRYCTTDLRGQEVEVGHTVAVAFRVGNGCALRLGRVESLRDDTTYRNPVRKAKITWTTGSVKSSEIEVDSARIAVIV